MLGDGEVEENVEGRESEVVDKAKKVYAHRSRVGKCCDEVCYVCRHIKGLIDGLVGSLLISIGKVKGSEEGFGGEKKVELGKGVAIAGEYVIFMVSGVLLGLKER